MVDNSDRDDLAALDFHTDGGHESLSDSDALDFSVADGDTSASALDAFDDFAPADTAATETVVEDLTDEPVEEPEADPLDPFTVSVTNPPQTVTVSAIVDGSIRQVELSPKAADMSESQLAEEVLVLADLAREKGRAAQHTYLLGNPFLSGMMSELQLDGDEVLRDFMENGMKLPTPDQAAAAEAEVFATRYSTDEH